MNQYLQGGDKISAASGNINNGIFKKFGEFDTVTGKIEVVTTGLWSGDTGSLTTFFTSSTQVAAASGDYYYNVYDTSATSSVQFTVAYGHVSGSGSVSLKILTMLNSLQKLHTINIEQFYLTKQTLYLPCWGLMVQRT